MKPEKEEESHVKEDAAHWDYRGRFDRAVKKFKGFGLPPPR